VRFFRAPLHLPFMFGQGKRGILLDMNLEKMPKQIEMLFRIKTDFDSKSKMLWFGPGTTL
jgi:hypothetical protein